MSISTDSLQAFLTTFEQGSFTKAALVLGMTQSALSQKVQRLEGQLQNSLIIRKPEGLLLTSSGERLLVYAKQALQMQNDFLTDFEQTSTQLAGSFRLYGFSSITRSILISRLSPWLRKNPKVSIEFNSKEMNELIPMLKSNQADAIVLDYSPRLSGIEEVIIGSEEYVLIESAKHKDTPDIYLDHGPQDNATESFFKFQGIKSNFRRGFMGDVYGILDGVANGLGKAVMSKHLVDGDKRFKIIKSKKKYSRSLVLCYFKQDYYSPIQQSIIELLKS